MSISLVSKVDKISETNWNKNILSFEVMQVNLLRQFFFSTLYYPFHSYSNELEIKESPIVYELERRCELTLQTQTVPKLVLHCQ